MRMLRRKPAPSRGSARRRRRHRSNIITQPTTWSCMSTAKNLRDQIMLKEWEQRAVYFAAPSCAHNRLVDKRYKWLLTSFINITRFATGSSAPARRSFEERRRWPRTCACTLRSPGPQASATLAHHAPTATMLLRSSSPARKQELSCIWANLVKEISRAPFNINCMIFSIEPSLNIQHYINNHTKFVVGLI